MCNCKIQLDGKDDPLKFNCGDCKIVCVRMYDSLNLFL